MREGVDWKRGKYVSEAGQPLCKDVGLGEVLPGVNGGEDWLFTICNFPPNISAAMPLLLCERMIGTFPSGVGR